ncbi:MAG: hypothetical protein HY332_01300 [Chloroflexi bacterium]|nr:hypothetical protein [Chloroflexota bacterium]
MGASLWTRPTRPSTSFTAALPSERVRLVRLCTHLTGNADAAEDLAQETLYEAWRNARPAARRPHGNGRHHHRAVALHLRVAVISSAPTDRRSIPNVIGSPRPRLITAVVTSDVVATRWPSTAMTRSPSRTSRPAGHRGLGATRRPPEGCAGAVSRHAVLIVSVVCAMHQQMPRSHEGHRQSQNCPSCRSSQATASAIN